MWLRSLRGALFEVLDIVFEFSTFMNCNCTGASTCQSYGGGRCIPWLRVASYRRSRMPPSCRCTSRGRDGTMPSSSSSSKTPGQPPPVERNSRLAPQASSAAEAAGGPAAAHCSACKCSRLGQQQSEERRSIRGADGVEPDPADDGAPCGGGTPAGIEPRCQSTVKRSSRSQWAQGMLGGGR